MKFHLSKFQFQFNIEYIFRKVSKAGKYYEIIATFRKNKKGKLTGIHIFSHRAQSNRFHSVSR